MKWRMFSWRILSSLKTHSAIVWMPQPIVAGHVCSAITGGGGIQQERCDVIMSTWTRSSDETSCGTQVNKNCY